MISLFDKRGNLWGLAAMENLAFMVHKGPDQSHEYQTIQFVAGGLTSSEVPGPTASAWGTGDERYLLYVATTGRSCIAYRWDLR